ncbi:Phage terminase large subunit [Streptococcus pneumoniae]|nr:Phage terminase large subunit [Streptococcus pneumoniae]
MSGAKKFQGSRLANTKKVKRFKKIYCSTACPNIRRELRNLTYKKDKNGNIILDEFNIDPHTFSAIWYGLDGYEVSDLKELSQVSAFERVF